VNIDNRSDDETGGFEFDNMNQFAGGTKEVGFLSQGSALRSALRSASFAFNRFGIRLHQGTLRRR
jgi:hypothetical protein